MVTLKVYERVSIQRVAARGDTGNSVVNAEQ